MAAGAGGRTQPRRLGPQRDRALEVVGARRQLASDSRTPAGGTSEADHRHGRGRATGTEPAVLFPVGPDRYAIPVGWVREVVSTPPLTTLVTAPALVWGLFNLRGQIVPLLDTAGLLGLGGGGRATFAVVLQSRDGLMGLAATGFPRWVLLGPSLGPSELPGTAGTYDVGGEVAVLLDPAVLLGSDRLRGADRMLPGGGS